MSNKQEACYGRYDDKTDPQTLHRAIHAFLKAEAESPNTPWKRAHVDFMMKRFLLWKAEPKFTDKAENCARYRALLSIRRDLLHRFPPDLAVREVRNLFDQNNSEKIVLLYPKDPATLDRVKGCSALLEGIWLWQASESDSSLYVVEGNHRVSRWKLDGCQPQRASVFVLRSPSGLPCCIPGVPPGGDERFVKPGDTALLPHWGFLFEGQSNPDMSLALVARIAYESGLVGNAAALVERHAIFKPIVLLLLLIFVLLFFF